MHYSWMGHPIVWDSRNGDTGRMWLRKALTRATRRSDVSMQTGKEIRLRRIWKHRKAVIIPFDHGLYSGPVRGIEDPQVLTQRICATDADAILVAPGVLRSVAPFLGQLGVIVRMDGGFTRYAPAPSDYRPLVSVENAVRLGADAGIVFTFVGTDDEGISMQRLGEAAGDAETWGFPIVSEVLAPSLLDNHFGRAMVPRSRKSKDILGETMVAARVCAEAGADVIKTRYTGSVAGFRDVVRSCNAKVIVAGGPAMNGSDEELLRLAYECVQADAAGIVFGRNVWQHPKMEKLIKALCAIVHEGELVSKALKLLR
jgi:DhnA family fructose-bisphosphate aldolase class Ia